MWTLTLKAREENSVLRASDHWDRSIFSHEVKFRLGQSFESSIHCDLILLSISSEVDNNGFRRPPPPKECSDAAAWDARLAVEKSLSALTWSAGPSVSMLKRCMGSGSLQEET